MVDPGATLAPTTPNPHPAEEGSHFHGSRSCPLADGHPETMKIPEVTPDRDPPSPLSSPLGRGKRGRGDRVRGIFKAARNLASPPVLSEILLPRSTAGSE